MIERHCPLSMATVPGQQTRTNITAYSQLHKFECSYFLCYYLPFNDINWL